jgi:chromosome segregation ATPase
MSESDKMSFISDNAELFKGSGGQELLDAFKNGNYDAIEDKLSTQLEGKRQLQLVEIERTLAIEKARGEKNEAYIAALEEYKDYLNDTTNLFKASLETRLEQEEAQLEEFKSYLEKEQEALVDSLNKRKEAYQKYFDDIKDLDDEKEYEEESERLLNNLAKLGTSTNAASLEMQRDLQEQYKELESDRIKDQREKAQDKILENMDNEVEEINKKFDKLLTSNQALLAAMQGDLQDPNKFISNLIGAKIESGATALEVEDYIHSLEGVYSSVLGNDVDWDAIQVREENNQLFLNVNGQEILLDTQNEKNLYATIKKALREIGVR